MGILRGACSLKCVFLLPFLDSQIVVPAGGRSLVLRGDAEVRRHFEAMGVGYVGLVIKSDERGITGTPRTGSGRGGISGRGVPVAVFSSGGSGGICRPAGQSRG
jgi:hypothetical protein